ncbi:MULTISPECIES: hypothetical protein [unclassified Campylobacter]|uniref:hypothetical protein n=1 Tax=unclassified Campylobacter TaxID=2593542 RepID=UPI0022E9ED6E|nr:MULTISPECIES: hypothetical protein [unclassified Campylobacter]MDA3054686.1 hypothetical protein [Campylobacter sp. VBCF_07 NA4]MDA3061280.1 hypothetical protein [Campylobacter sp. VBCF_02 NA5]MDA3070636.1 hypothetical protein [Campylobacter sp. VBCF_08 NA3]
MGIWQKSFGGLDRAYYLRHLLFGILIAGVFIYMQVGMNERIASRTGKPMELEVLTCVAAGVLALLYPYARFVYESIMNFILGDNVFFVNIFIMLIWKLIVAFFLFCFSFVVAPIGLLYLYYYHTKNHTFDENSSDYSEFIEKGDEK